MTPTAPDAELLSIGRFARLSGLSIGALRHYHELGLLVPARIDPETGYRSYARGQLDPARLVARLRELDLPLPEVRAILGADAALRASLLWPIARGSSRSWRAPSARSTGSTEPSTTRNRS